MESIPWPAEITMSSPDYICDSDAQKALSLSSVTYIISYAFLAIVGKFIPGVARSFFSLPAVFSLVGPTVLYIVSTKTIVS